MICTLFFVYFWYNLAIKIFFLPLLFACCVVVVVVATKEQSSLSVVDFLHQLFVNKDHLMYM